MFVSNQAFANDMSYGDNSLSKTFTEILSATPVFDYEEGEVDYFHVWLRTIFGSFIFEPWTQDSGDISILASAVGFTNLLAVTFGTVVMVYVLGGGALNSAHSGEVLNRNWSPVWMPIRTVLGIGLIIPAPAIGGGVLSMAQLAIIWLVIFGSNAATFLWDNTASQFVQKGVYGYSPVSTGNRPLLNLTQSMICIDHSVKHERKVNGKLPAGAKDNESLLGVMSYYTGKELKIANSGGDNTLTHEVKTMEVWVPLSPPMSAETYTRRIRDIKPLISELKSIDQVKSFEFANSCGSFDVFTKSDLTIDPQDRFDNVDVKINDTFEDAYRIFQKDVLPSALSSAFSVAVSLGDIDKGNPERALQSIVKPSDGGESGKESLKDLDKAASTFSKAGEKFTKGIQVTIPQFLHQELTENEKVQHDKITRGGWAAAGLWFIEIGKTNQLISSAIDASKQVHPPSGVDICDNAAPKTTYYFRGSHTAKADASNKACANTVANYQSSKSLMNLAYKSIGKGVEGISAKDPSQPNATGSFDPLASCPEPSDCDISEDIDSEYTVGVAQAILGHLSQTHMFSNQDDAYSVQGNMFNPSGFANPFLTLSNIGSTMNNYALTGYLIANITSAAGTTMIHGDGVTKWIPGSAEVQAFVGQLATNAAYMIFLVAAGLMSAGFVLAYMVPFLPIMAWTNMMIGYLITVIEAVTAAPLAVIQMLLPEGQGILGQRLERAMQLLIVVILKPSLMIIGLIAAITISGLGFTIFNTYFWVAAKNHSYFNPIAIFAIITIYTSSALTLATMIVSIMHTLPNHILEWFAGHSGGRSFGEDKVGDA
ncbi:DotA/TraY family protein, partial [Vibrio splendidus]